MKKSVIGVSALIILALVTTGCYWKKQKSVAEPAAVLETSQNKDFETVALFSSMSPAPNRVWAGTFQIVWNDFMNEIVGGPVKFVGYNSPLADGLNKQAFRAEQISAKDYYKAWGDVSPKMKAKIEKGIKDKFNEKSDILDLMDWTPAADKYIVYAMLKKDFQFKDAFDELADAKFGNDKTLVKYFGTKPETKERLDDNIQVLFYNNENDFALKLLTQSSDEVYLYRTGDDKPFEQFFNDMNRKTDAYYGSQNRVKLGLFKVPDISLYKLKSFDELCGKIIEGKSFMIDQAIETVDFKMNKQGVKLKSEAAIMTRNSAILDTTAPKNFYFDNTFVLFLKEKDKKQPYFALRVHNVSDINKTGRSK